MNKIRETIAIMSFIILSIFLCSLSFVNAYNGDFCTQYNTPCSLTGVGTTICTSTDLSYMYQNYDFVNDFSGVGDITGWNTSCITDMTALFDSSNFNQDISNWDTSSVTSMSQMFAYTPFNQNLGFWNISSLSGATNMFLGVTLSSNNYDSLISNWFVQVDNGDFTCSKNYLHFNGGYSQYSSLSSVAHDNLVNSCSWFIDDGGLLSYPTNNMTTASNWDCTNSGELVYPYCSYGNDNDWNTYYISQYFLDDTSNYYYIDSLWNTNINLSYVNVTIEILQSVNRLEPYYSFPYVQAYNFNTLTYDTIYTSTIQNNNMYYTFNLTNDYWNNTGSIMLRFNGFQTVYFSNGSFGYNGLYDVGLSYDGSDFITCIENWIETDTTCNGFNYTIEYQDLNNCGTYNNLPINNGTIINCTIDNGNAFIIKNVDTQPIIMTVIALMIITIIIALLFGFFSDTLGMDSEQVWKIVAIIVATCIIILIIAFLNATL